MNNIATLLLLIIALKSYSQERDTTSSFKLVGSINRDSGNICLWYPDSLGHWKKDTVTIHNGGFEFSGVLYEHSFCWLKDPVKENSIGIFLEPTNQKIILDEEDINNFKLTGSYTQQQADTLEQRLEKINARYKEWIAEYDTIISHLRKTKDSVYKKHLLRKLDSIVDRNGIISLSRTKEIMAFINTHPDSYVSTSYLVSYLDSREITTDSLERIYNRFSGKIKASYTGRLILQKLNKRKLTIKAPDFSISDYNNKNISLSDYRGKYVLIDFWATWCVPCIKQIPELKVLQNKYNNKGFQIICISIDTSFQKWVEAIKKYKIESFRHVLGNDDIAAKYPNTKQPIPNQILLNREGIVVWNSFDTSKELKVVLAKEFGN